MVRSSSQLDSASRQNASNSCAVTTKMDKCNPCTVRVPTYSCIVVMHDQQCVGACVRVRVWMRAHAWLCVCLCMCILLSSNLNQ